MLTTLEIENFTVFKKAKFDFVPGINVFIGANASGKTHLLKLLYAIQKSQIDPDSSVARLNVQDELMAVFRPENLWDIIRNGRQMSSVISKWNNAELSFQLVVQSRNGSSNISHKDKIAGVTVNGWWSYVNVPVFIPVKDMLGNSVGFNSLYDSRNIDFDGTYRDILTFAFLPSLRQPIDSEYASALEILAQKLEGTVEVKGERFYLTGKNGTFEMHMVAEGWRKFALLYLLIANGSIRPGSVLYWDEPETNLNPSLMDELAQILLMLARKGTQIFLATHNYIILKELELQKLESDTLQLFAMDRSEKDGSVTPRPASVYSELKPNLIADQFNRIYDLQIDKALGKKNGKRDR